MNRLIGRAYTLSPRETPSTAPKDTSFVCWRLNSSTFVVKEEDAFGELPHVYVKILTKAQAVVITDTGCDFPRETHKDARYDHLRSYLETYPIRSNQDQPLNPQGQKRYIIVCSHCHYDHIGGIEQFLSEGNNTEIIASAAGRDFIESDLDRHSLFSLLGRSAPSYKVTHWATAFERYRGGATATKSATATAIFEGFRRQTDYGMMFIHTPGHTPDSMAWYDESEMQLFVGDSLYEEGAEGMPIVFVRDSDLVEWYYSMVKLLHFVRSRMYRSVSRSKRHAPKLNVSSSSSNNNNNNNINNEDDDADDEEREWVKMGRRVKLAAGHQTYSADAEEILERLLVFWKRLVKNEVPVVKKAFLHSEKQYTWRDEGGGASKMSFSAPLRLMQAAQAMLGDHLNEVG